MNGFEIYFFVADNGTLTRNQVYDVMDVSEQVVGATTSHKSQPPPKTWIRLNIHKGDTTQ